MASLVSQDEALRQLRMIETALTADQLADVNAKAEQASAIVVDYLKVPFIEGPLAPTQNRAQRRQVTVPGQRDTSDQAPPAPPIFDWGWGGPPSPSVPPTPPDPWTPANVPTLVKSMILAVLTALYDGRTPEDVFLSPSVVAVLARMRDPAMA